MHPSRRNAMAGGFRHFCSEIYIVLYNYDIPVGRPQVKALLQSLDFNQVGMLGVILDFILVTDVS